MKTGDDKTTASPVPHYIGHRERLRSRFLLDNGQNMADYELLELLLAIAIPRHDVKEKAKKLIESFGSFAAVINAPQNVLLEYGLSLNTVAALKIVAAAAVKMSWQELKESNEPVISNYDYMVDYCRSAMAYLDVEEFRVLFLNAKLQIITEKIMQRGTVNNVAIHPREVVKAALECGAVSIILMHNHPGGKAQPSKSDLLQTRTIVEALEPLNIKVHDHLIITKESYYSFLANGLLSA